MAQITVVYWRDIPAQIIAGSGRRAPKVQLPERFEQAIDRAAMKDGATGTDAYLEDWREAAPYEVPGADDEAAAREAARIDADYTKEKLLALIANAGRESTS